VNVLLAIFFVVLVVGFVYWVFSTFDFIDIFSAAFILVVLYGLGALTFALLRGDTSHG
jgi:hypothetical protein